MLNSTYLAIYDDEIIGFFTLATDKQRINKLGKEYKEKFANKISYKEFATIKIDRLSISSSYSGKGVGTFLLQLIIDMSLKLSKKVGFRFVTIDVYISAYDFYKKDYCKDSFSNEKLKKEFEKFKIARVNDTQSANTMTVPMFMDLYKFK